MADRLAFTVPVPLGIDAADDHSSYFKFNLAFINLFSLIRLEANSGNRGWYEKGFDEVREHHGQPSERALQYDRPGAAWALTAYAMPRRARFWMRG